MRALTLQGVQFGRLTVVGRAESTNAVAAWLCQCACGRMQTCATNNLRSGNSTQCTHCAAVQRGHGHKPRHGHCRSSGATSEYNIWKGIKLRCTKRSHASFSNYGGRGITVCDSWRTSFENFLADVGLRPSTQHQLDRIDNDGNYEPANCRWSTVTENARNKRNSLKLSHNSSTRTLVEWSEITGIKYRTLRMRVELGWSSERALTPQLPRLAA